MFSAVLFDLDDTLHDRAGSLRQFLIKQHQRSFMGRVAVENFVDGFLCLDAHGSLAKSVLYPRLMTELEIDDVPGDLLTAEYGRDFHQHARPADGALSLLTALRQTGIKLGVVSNGWTDFQQRTVDAIGVRDAVDAILISEAEGLRKPDARLFKRAADRLGITPEACLFVGDNPVADVLGAQTAGMRSVWLRRGMEWPSEHPPAMLRVDHLLEILELASGQPQRT